MQTPFGPRIAAWIAALQPALVLVLFFANSTERRIASTTYSVCIALYLLQLAFAGKQGRPPALRTYATIVAVYLAALALALTYSPDLADGSRRFFSQTKILIVLVIIEHVRTHAAARKYLLAGAAGGTILSLIALGEGLLLGVNRPPAAWNPVHGGNLLLFSFILVLVMLLYEKKRALRTALVLSLLAHSGALYLNATRSAWLACAVVLLAAPVFLPRMRASAKAAFYVLLAVVVISLFQLSFFQVRVAGTLVDLERSMTSRTHQSFGGRYEMWLASYDMFRHAPVLGVGLGGWYEGLQVRVRSGLVSPAVLDYNQAHNIYLDVLSTRGMVGFAMFLALLVYPVLYVWKRTAPDEEQYRTLLLLSSIAFFVSGLTDTLVYIRGVYMWHLLLTGISLGVLHGQRSRENEGAVGS